MTQLVLHRGAQAKRKGETYAEATERVLDARGLSTTMTVDIDGTVYQHFDPAKRRGRHATHHNVQSDSIDVAGPFSRRKWDPVPGQVPVDLRVAIGRKGDNKPPLSRRKATVRAWSLTPEQHTAINLLVPWWCSVRGIEPTACHDLRCFRVGGLGLEDPVTDVRGIVAHGQVSGPGQRVDGFLSLEALREGAEGIEWREEFL